MTPLICPVCQKDIASVNTVQEYYDSVMSDPEMGADERKCAQEEYDSVEDKASIASYVSETGYWCDGCNRFYDQEDVTEERMMISGRARS